MTRSSTRQTERLPRRPAGSSSDGVVVFAGLDWWYHNRAHSDFQLALRLARTRRVLLVNSIGTRMPAPGRTSHIGQRVRRKLSSIARLVRRPIDTLPNFHVYSPLTVPAYGSVVGRRLNAALVRAQVRAVAAWARLVSPTIIVTPPTAWDVVSGMSRSGLVFNRSDKHSSWSEVDAEYLGSLERHLLAGSDAVLYVAHSLMDEDSGLVGSRAVFLDHGVDLEAFRPGLTVPADIRSIPGPRIGYFGSLRDHTVDIELLKQVATAIPDAQLVLVGPSTIMDKSLFELPNVHWLGQRPHEEIPAYGAGFDVALMPWRDNEWIKSCNPIKMKEYLALGLPVVTTDFPEAHRYASVLDIAADPGDFIARIRRILESDGLAPGAVAKRREAVATSSWDTTAERLADVIDGLG